MAVGKPSATMERRPANRRPATVICRWQTSLTRAVYSSVGSPPALTPGPYAVVIAIWCDSSAQSANSLRQSTPWVTQLSPTCVDMTGRPYMLTRSLALRRKRSACSSERGHSVKYKPAAASHKMWRFGKILNLGSLMRTRFPPWSPCGKSPNLLSLKKPSASWRGWWRSPTIWIRDRSMRFNDQRFSDSRSVVTACCKAHNAEGARSNAAMSCSSAPMIPSGLYPRSA
mmetsp:Transcript_62142/g.173599  ORF Transcript_62142/g.173599 Transcript_62142/m.173599 type:complete len:228 (+) Transcript_62142:269-952(+)